MNNEPKKSREYISQGDMPRCSLADTLVLAKSLRDSFASKGTTPINLAQAVNRSPSSSAWRILTGAAVAYGITSGAYNSSEISLTPLGDKIVNPTEDGADSVALLQAALRPSILKAFYEKYDGQKLPKDDIGKNVLRQFGVPQERTNEAWEVMLENAKLLNILMDVSGSQYIQLRKAKDELGKSEASFKREEQDRPYPPIQIPPKREVSHAGSHTQAVIRGKVGIFIPEEWNINTPIDNELHDLWGTAIKALHIYAKKYEEKHPDEGSG